MAAATDGGLRAQVEDLSGAEPQDAAQRQWTAGRDSGAATTRIALLIAAQEHYRAILMGEAQQWVVPDLLPGRERAQFFGPGETYGNASIVQGWTSALAMIPLHTRA
eukprot:3242627-Heterocapsa_arctica.AAC.1